MAMDERIWLRHNETGGFFHAPAEVVEVFEGLGWQPADGPPTEPNPVVAERIAFERELRAKAAQEAKAKTKAKKTEAKAEEEHDETTETPRRGTTEKEG